MNTILLSILVYIALQLVVVFFVSRRPQSEEDYLLAGRRLGPWLSTFSVFATWFGAETCIGATAEAYRGGLAAVAADPFGYTLGLAITGLFFAAALWRRGIVTLADLFRQRYGGAVERLAALIMIPSSLLWAAAQVRAFGQVLASVSELGVALATALAAVVVIVYTAVGGMWADAWTDLVQGLVLILGLVLLAAVFVGLGGLDQVHLAAAAGSAAGAAAERRPLLEVMAVPIFGTIAAQELTSRVLAMRSPQLARMATVGGAALYLAIGLIPVVLGLGAAAFVGSAAEPEQVLSQFAQRYLPTPLYVLFLGALVSAILSTLSGALLVAGSLAAHNVVMPMLGGRLTERSKLRFNRIAVVVFGIAAYLIARGSESMYKLVEEASGLASGGVLVLIVFALWLPRIGGTVSAVGALLASLLLYLLGEHIFEWRAPYLASLAAAALTYLLLAGVKARAADAPLPASAA
ncbi:MAG: sodium:solute symporter [Nevskia sp.]